MSKDRAGDDCVVPHYPSNFKDADALVTMTTTTNVDCNDHREAVIGEGTTSTVLPTIGVTDTAHRFPCEKEQHRVIETETGHDPEENQEVSFEEYITHSARTGERRRVQFVECEAIDQALRALWATTRRIRSTPRTGTPPVPAPSTSRLPDQKGPTRTGRPDTDTLCHSRGRRYHGWDSIEERGRTRDRPKRKRMHSRINGHDGNHYLLTRTK
jgi:hypothetical protein